MQHGFDTRIVTRRVRQPTLYLVVWNGVSLKVVPLGSVPFIATCATRTTLSWCAEKM